MKKLKTPLTRAEMKNVMGGFYPCDFGGYVCPDFPLCDNPTNPNGWEYQCIHNTCRIVNCA